MIERQKHITTDLLQIIVSDLSCQIIIKKFIKILLNTPCYIQ